MKQTDTTEIRGVLKISSPAFANNGYIPERYTCDGININPPLKIENIPGQAKSLAVIMDDPDAPGGIWVHWVIWNIPITHVIKEDQAPGSQGINDFGKHEYGGPCPPKGTHHYFFKVYALDCTLGIPPNSKKEDLLKAMNNDIVAYGELIGLY